MKMVIIIKKELKCQIHTNGSSGSKIMDHNIEFYGLCEKCN